MNLFFVSISVLIINIPFGYWRQHVRKFSLGWILAVHLPVPFVVLLRFSFHLGFQLYTYPFLVIAFFLGQFFGGKVYHFRNKHYFYPLTGCLIMDLFRQGTAK
jgi:hypothetical protein